MSKNKTESNKWPWIIWIFLAFSLSIYSYALVDPNFTLIDTPLWGVFREGMVYLGYYQRDISFLIYFSIISFLSVAALLIRKKEYQPTKEVVHLVGVAFLLSYPFLSHDFFNYIFDAKIFTFYHQNPYLMRPLDFPHDPILRFMHWTHRTYPYGPTFLPLTIIISFIGGGKFLITYALMKLLFIGAFIATFLRLYKQHKTVAMAFLTSPLIILEGLVNMHNDFLAVSFLLLSWGVTAFVPKVGLVLLSGGIKYITLPFALSVVETKHRQYLLDAIFILITGLLGYAIYLNGPHVWYLLNFVPFLIFFPALLALSIEYVALLAYTPYILFGGWDSPVRVGYHDTLFYVAFVAIVASYVFLRSKRKAIFFIK